MEEAEEQEDERDHWSGRLPFLLAAMGSAIGLGNVWRFPYIAYENGGGAFLIPYFIALLTTGIPLMALELGLGYKFLSGAPKAFAKVDRRLAWVGWLSIFLGFLILTFYTVIMAWCLIYMFFSFDASWGSTAPEIQGFFFNDFLHISSGPTVIGGFQPMIFVGLIVIWLCVYFILSKGVQRVGKVVLITVPLPIILLIILFIRGITLPGAMDGIEYYLTPDASRLGDANVWLAAYGQIFFTLSLAQGVMIAYASYLPKKSEIMNNATIISLANCGTSFFAGLVVFSILGFVSHETGQPIGSGASGPHLAFITYPIAISQMGGATALFGVIFFLMLLTLGIDSAFSMVEALSAGLEDLGWEHEKAVRFFCIIGLSIGLLFVTSVSFWMIHLIDHFAVGIGIVVVGLFEVLVIGYVMKPEELREFINEHSEVKIGRWWDIMIRYVTPAILIFIIIMTLKDGFEFTGESVPGNVVEYPTWLVFAGGYGLIIVLVVVALYMQRRYGKWH